MAVVPVVTGVLDLRHDLLPDPVAEVLAKFEEEIARLKDRVQELETKLK